MQLRFYMHSSLLLHYEYVDTMLIMLTLCWHYVDTMFVDYVDTMLTLCWHYVCWLYFTMISVIYHTIAIAIWLLYTCNNRILCFKTCVAIATWFILVYIIVSIEMKMIHSSTVGIIMAIVVLTSGRLIIL